ncbi:hypothetical protein [Cellulomonas sp.]|uniref:hypothetical protein n=1 Tax=Cellulomonas sp. TaxID=40001 RepID=UPI001B131FD5|nr:hypothetical protein [Cellulomonas sp.]MBO9556939.1 hypothetical protein [Cellulomonas sp.]
MKKSQFIAAAFVVLAAALPASAQAATVYTSITGATAWSLAPNVDAGVNDTAADDKRAYTHFYRVGSSTRYLVETRNGNGTGAISSSGAKVTRVSPCTNNNVEPESCGTYAYTGY